MARLPVARLLPAATAALALTLRLVHLWGTWPLHMTEPPAVGMDRWLNMHVAEAVANGRWLGGWAAAYDSSPGYSYILGGLYWLSGRHWLGPLLVQAALGAGTSIALYGLGRRLFSWQVGVVAALLAALYGPFVFYEALLVKFSLLPFTVSVALLCAAAARQTTSLRWSLLAGLALGVLVLLRPNGALAVPVVLAWVVWPPARTRRRALAELALTLVAGVSLVLGPMAVRNAAAEAAGVASSLWGIHFYIGNHPEADGSYVSVPGVREDIIGHVDDARQVAAAAVGRPLGPGGVSRYWAARGLDFVRTEPGHWLWLQLRKVWLAFDAEESGSFGDDYELERRDAPVLRLPLFTFGVIAPLALFALLDAVDRRRGALLVLFMAAYLVSLLPFFVEGRYRLPLAPPLLVLAAAGLERLATATEKRGQRALVAPTLGLVVVAIALRGTLAQVLLLVASVALGGAGVQWLGRRVVDEGTVLGTERAPTA